MPGGPCKCGKNDARAAPRCAAMHRTASMNTPASPTWGLAGLFAAVALLAACGGGGGGASADAPSTAGPSSAPPSSPATPPSPSPPGPSPSPATPAPPAPSPPAAGETLPSNDAPQAGSTTAVGNGVEGVWVVADDSFSGFAVIDAAGNYLSFDPAGILLD